MLDLVEMRRQLENSTGMQCLCGAYLGRHNAGGETDRIVPEQ